MFSWRGGNNRSIDEPSYGTLGVASPTTSPAFLVRTQGFSSSNGTAWVFSGQNVFGSIVSDTTLWTFDGKFWTWKGGNKGSIAEVRGPKGIFQSSNTPSSRYMACTVSKGDIGWMFGGYANNIFSNVADIWQLDMETGTWAWFYSNSTTAAVYGTKGVSKASNYPGARASSLCWVDSNNALWIFGGISTFYNPNTINSYSDLWKWDGNWTWISGQDGIGNKGYSAGLGISDPQNYPSSLFNNQDSACWLGADDSLWMFGPASI